MSLDVWDVAKSDDYFKIASVYQEQCRRADPRHSTSENRGASLSFTALRQRRCQLQLFAANFEFAILYATLL